MEIICLLCASSVHCESPELTGESTMDMHTLTRELHTQNDSKIVMLVGDGLGGLPLTPAERRSWKPHAHPTWTHWPRRGVQGLSIPVKPGIAPGSRAWASGPVWLRSTTVPNRSRSSRGNRNRIRTAAGRRGHSLQFLHPRRPGQDLRSPSRPDCYRGKLPRLSFRLRQIKIPG